MTDRADFEAWYRREHPRLVTALTLAAGSRDVAEDVAAEALSRCLDRWDGPRRPVDPSAWTYTVAVNLLRRSWRRRQRDALVAIHLARRPTSTSTTQRWSCGGRSPAWRPGLGWRSCCATSAA